MSIRNSKMFTLAGLASAASALMANDESGARADDTAEPKAGDEPKVVEVDPLVGVTSATAEPLAPAADDEPEIPAGDTAALAAFAADREAAGRAEMAARIETVFASEHIAGREQAAALLLAADVPADKIVAKLPNMAKGDSGDAMLKALGTGGNPDLAAGGETNVDTTKASATFWDRAQKSAGILPATK